MYNYNKAYQKSLSRTINKGDGLDFWRTPPQATQALMEHEDFYGSTLEPACGVGDMANVLFLNPNINVFPTDIVNRGWKKQALTIDFFLMPPSSSNVITNPPFNLAQKFIEHALKITTKKVAMLLKLEFIQSIKRYDLFKSTPLKRMLVFSYRVPFWQEGYDKAINNQRHAWYIWEHGYKGKWELDLINVPDGGVDKEWWKQKEN